MTNGHQHVLVREPVSSVDDDVIGAAGGDVENETFDSAELFAGGIVDLDARELHTVFRGLEIFRVDILQPGQRMIHESSLPSLEEQKLRLRAMIAG